jgi:hypothetical protein
MPPRCLFFGCWNQAGHYLFVPGGRSAYSAGLRERFEYYGDRVHLDGTLAPRRHKYTEQLCWSGQGATPEQQQRITYDSDEYPQGQFLRHVLSTGFTAIQWWDRTQGDTRGACNSTILLEGEHTDEEMLAALRENFPHVLANLDAAGIKLISVQK